MRKWHRWTAVLFGVFLLWIAVTGSLTQFARMTASREPRPAAAAAPRPAAPRAEPPRPAPSASRQFIHFVTELHSGEAFGLPGMIISLLSGLAMVFFAVSGLWMYVQLYTGRLKRIPNPSARERFFWR